MNFFMKSTYDAIFSNNNKMVLFARLLFMDTTYDSNSLC